MRQEMRTREVMMWVGQCPRCGKEQESYIKAVDKLCDDCIKQEKLQKAEDLLKQFEPMKFEFDENKITAIIMSGFKFKCEINYDNILKVK